MLRRTCMSRLVQVTFVVVPLRAGRLVSEDFDDPKESSQLHEDRHSGSSESRTGALALPKPLGAHQSESN
jgi:hypothetical protein